MSNLIALGYVAKAFGIRGGVAVKLFFAASESIKPGTALTVRLKNKEFILKVKEIVPPARIIFEGISDRDEAEALRGAQLFIERSALPVLPDDEFYLADILGAKVVLLDGKKVGEVVDFGSNGAQTLIEITTCAGHRASIPLVKEIVKEIDATNKVIVIDPPEGLLDAQE